MADYKTAEQYVVARCEDLELQLEATKAKYKKELCELGKMYDQVKAELCEAYDLLGMLRDHIVLRNSCYGRAIHVETIYETEHWETIEALADYFDLRIEEDEENA